MMIKKISALLLLNVCAFVFASDGVFELKAVKDSYTVNFKGKTLIVGEGFTPGFSPDKSIIEKHGSDLILSAWGTAHTLKWRREAATVENGKELELTFQVMLPAFNEDHYKGDVLRYIEIPVSVLDGCDFTAFVGGTKRNKYVKGRISAQRRDGSLLGGAVRCIAFSKKDFNLVVDFAPSGVQDLYSSYTVGSLSGFGSLQKVGDRIRFCMGTKSNRNGGIHTGKMVIYEGTEKDFKVRHARDKYSYYSELEAEKRYVFGADRTGKGKKRAHLLPYSAKRTFGWVNKGNAAIEKFRPEGTLYSAVAGNKTAVFQADLERKGLYIVNINLGTGEKALKGMNLKLNDRVLVKDLAVAARTAQKIQVPMWIENHKATFEFSGNWRVSEITFQLLLASKEDLSLRRALWLSKNTDYPAVFFHNEHYAEEPPYNVHLSNYPLPEPGKEAVGKARLPEWTTGYGDMSKYKNKIFSAMIGSWGTSNAGTFSEFEAPGAIQRNIAELRQNNIDIVMFNGMLARHTFAKPHKVRLHNVIGKYIKEARKVKKDFIFIDHVDYSMLWNSDSGFRRMLEWNDCLQETIDGGLPGRARCMSNPKAVQEFYDTIMEHIRKTDLDGIMVDECAFMTTAFCGCAHCRKTFTADTGFQLPANELSPDLNNPKSYLWRVWQEWRRRKIGEFWVNLRKKVSEYRKDFIFIGYTTEYGLTASWAPNDLGSDIFNYARAWDMIGTEIMPRNIYACARAINSTRKAFSVFNRTGNTPVFGLVYASDWKIKYFGWAMNNLNGQQTWETRFIPCPEGEVNFRTFTVEKGNMDLARAKSAAKVALLFSENSRNMAGAFSSAGSYRRELFGTAQMLEKMHIDYDMISDLDVNAEKLSRYSVLMLGNSSYLSDQQIAAIMDFMQKGGTVSASYMAGACNEVGVKRANDLAGTVFNWKTGAKGISGAEIAAVTVDGNAAAKPLRSVLFRRMPNVKSQPGEAVFVTKAKRVLPAVISKKTGKGLFVYYPGMYGSGNCSNYLMVGAKHTFEPDLPLEKFQKKLLSDLLAKNRSWEPLNVPEDVFTAAYTQDGKFVIHFLNAVNSMPKVGTVVGFYTDKTAFPALGDMSFTVPFKVKNAYAVSPEFAGRKALKIESAKSGSKITLPTGTMKVYSIVYLEK